MSCRTMVFDVDNLRCSVPVSLDFSLDLQLLPHLCQIAERSGRNMPASQCSSCVYTCTKGWSVDDMHLQDFASTHVSFSLRELLHRKKQQEAPCHSNAGDVTYTGWGWVALLRKFSKTGRPLEDLHGTARHCMALHGTASHCMGVGFLSFQCHLHLHQANASTLSKARGHRWVSSISGLALDVSPLKEISFVTY